MKGALHEWLESGRKSRIWTVDDGRMLLLPLTQIIDRAADHGPAIRSGNPRQRCQKRSIHLRSRWLHGANQISGQFGERDKHSYCDHPAPGPARPQQSQKHARHQDQKRGEKQVIDCDVHPTNCYPQNGRDEVHPPVGGVDNLDADHLFFFLSGDAGLMSTRVSLRPSFLAFTSTSVPHIGRTISSIMPSGT